MTLTHRKIEDLYLFYAKNGFYHTTNEIAEGMGISRKTFFNRYESKENATNIVIKEWFSRVRQRMEEKIAQSNHAVEALLQFGYELYNIKTKERLFYSFMKDHNLFISKEAPFVDLLADIIRDGISHYQFLEDVDVELYALFFMANYTHYDYADEDRSIIMQFVLSPILTERSYKLLEDVGIGNFF